jgi:hypothetical protein
MSAITEITFVASFGDVNFTFGEDGLDNFEDTQEVTVVRVVAETPEASLELALAAMPTAVELLKITADAQLAHMVGDDVRAFEHGAVDAAADFMGGEWEESFGGARKVIEQDGDYHTRWQVFTCDAAEGFTFPYGTVAASTLARMAS